MQRKPFTGNESRKKEEMEEIWRRIDYLKKTDNPSLAEKIAVAKKALKIIEKDERKRELEV